MSLNRYEQLLHDYIENRPEEKRYWTARVRDIAGASGRKEERVMSLNSQLWEYFEERSRYESPFKEIVVSEGTQRISMLNLSEYWIRMWGPPLISAKKKR